MTDQEINDQLAKTLTDNGWLPGVFGEHQPPIDTLRLALVDAVSYEDLGVLLSDMTADASYAVAIERHSGRVCIRDCNAGREVVGAELFPLPIEERRNRVREYQPWVPSYQGKEPKQAGLRTARSEVAAAQAAEQVAERIREAAAITEAARAKAAEFEY